MEKSCFESCLCWGISIFVFVFLCSIAREQIYFCFLVSWPQWPATRFRFLVFYLISTQYSLCSSTTGILLLAVEADFSFGLIVRSTRWLFRRLDHGLHWLSLESLSRARTFFALVRSFFSAADRTWLDVNFLFARSQRMCSVGFGILSSWVLGAGAISCPAFSLYLDFAYRLHAQEHTDPSYRSDLLYVFYSSVCPAVFPPQFRRRTSTVGLVAPLLGLNS
jgi:hypothetical protein